jgi:hypothetical protein
MIKGIALSPGRCFAVKSRAIAAMFVASTAKPYTVSVG